MIGATLGPYTVLAKLGEGGMGQVFRARDARLDREVAIKILPAAFAHDADRVARFTREARTLAALNHPHIAGIHGLEESGGVLALVMELVGGEDLSARIARGALPLDEALAIARQIADALDAAHAQGIVHRDLKPANIKLRPDGTVKVLDFGLAKAVDGSGTRPDVTNSPTITSPAMTHAGMILGTAAYMAPEQARGRPVDKRADVWAFGVVLFEMLTGKRLFAGDEVSDTIALVLTKEPDWASLPASTPPAITRLLRRCLAKDRAKRLADISDARLEFDDALNPSAVEARPTVAPAAAPRKRMLPWAMAAAAALAAMSMLVLWAPWRSAPSTPAAQAIRVRAELGAEVLLAQGPNIALSPDGRTLAIAGRTSRVSPPQVYVRSLDQLTATALAGTEGALGPAFSADGQWLTFVANRMLKKVPVNGGTVVTLGDFAIPMGTSWSDQNTIVAGGLTRGLVSIPAAGGEARTLTTLDETERGHTFPQVLPGGRAVLYTSVTANIQQAGVSTIVVRRLPGGEGQKLIENAYFARYVPSGHIVFVRNSAVFAAPFDLDTLTLRGEPAPILDGVASTSGNGGAALAIADNGTLAYVTNAVVDLARAPVLWLERSGAPRALRSTPAAWAAPRFSPDGRRLAMTITDGRQQDIWVYEWERDVLTRITSDPANDSNATWTPDGTGLVFASNRSGVNNLYWQRADGTGQARRLTESGQAQIPDAVHPDGRQLVFHVGNPAGGQQNIMLMRLERDAAGALTGGKPTPLVEGPSLKSNAVFSPDGRWLAYTSLETDRFEIYVQPFPGPGPRVQISSGGGHRAMWSRTSQELFYGGDAGQQRMMVVPYTVSGDVFVPQKSQPWSEASFSGNPPFFSYGPGFDMHPDGKRFAVAPAATGTTSDAPEHLDFIFNFFDELRRRVR